MSTAPRGPLEGFRVLDTTTSGAGAIATMLLADYGADVVMVEPADGHPRRGSTELRAWGRGKRSVVGDVTADLVRWADVLVEDAAGDQPPPTDPSHLVRCRISAFGPGSWRSDQRGVEELIQAAFGLRQGPDGPELVGFPWATYGAAFLAAFGTLAALYSREGGAPGQRVDVSLFDGVLLLSTMQGMRIEATPHAAVTMTEGRRQLSGIHRCADGEYVGIHTGAPGAFTRAVGALGLGDRFRPSPTTSEMGVPLVGDEARVVAEDVPTAIASMTRPEFLALMERTDVAAIAVLRPGEAFDDPQVRHNHLIVDVDDPEVGPLRQVGPPIRLSAAAGRVRSGAPAVGRHTDEVAAEAAAVPARRAPTDPHPPHVLAGLQVVDLGQYFAGPFGPRMMSDLGADVVKVEPPGGDPMRPLLSVFEAAQRGKRAVALDLKSDEGRRAFLRLAARADVVAHNFRPGAAERLGVGPADVWAVNPDAVYCANHGWGSTGPKSHLQSFAPLLQEFSGLSYMAAGLGNPPVTIGPNEDYYNAMLGAIGVLMALIDRRRSGRGQLVESPQVNSSLFAVCHVMTDPQGRLLPLPQLAADRRGFDATTRIYRTADGWVCIACRSADERAAFLEAVDLAGADADARSDALPALVEGRTVAHPTDHWLGVLTEADVPCERAATSSYLSGALWEDGLHRDLGRVVGRHHPDVGAISEVATMIHLSASPIPDRGVAPGLGEHTAEVLGELDADARHA